MWGKSGKTTNGRIAIVTVHGTGDTATGPDGDKWFQNGSAFAQRLMARLKGHGLEADIVPHLWSGANSATAREQGAEKLAKSIRLNAKTYDGVHVIGHSHGGNVANDAACVLNWSHKHRRPKIASMTTVGTPFFRTQVTRGERIGAWVFALVVFLSVFIAAGGTSFTEFLLRARAAEATQRAMVIGHVKEDLETRLFRTRWEMARSVSKSNKDPVRTKGGATQTPEFQRLMGERQSIENSLKPVTERFRDAQTELELQRIRDKAIVYRVRFLTVASFVSILFVMPLAVRGVRRIRRAGRRVRTDTAITSIWHPNDEAIAFLHRVEGLPIEPFPQGSLWRGSRTGGIQWGVFAVIATPIIGALLELAGSFGAPQSQAETLRLIALKEAGGNIVLWGAAGAPVVFGVVYLAYRLFAALALEFGLRDTLNRVVGDSLKGIALGRDGDNRIGEVAPCSHYYGAERVVLDGELAHRMLANSTGATQRLFNKYRGGLFSVGAESDNAFAELSTDAMTWDSLIHTTYFDQPEIADMIGDRIAAAARPTRL